MIGRIADEILEARAAAVEVGDALAKAKVLSFHRIAVGEGFGKKEEDFHAEVMKQAGLA